MNDELFEALYRKYYGRVYRFFRNFGVDNDASDLAQETFQRIYKFGKYRGEAEWSFIEKTARRVLLNWVRARKTTKRNVKMESLDDPAIPDPALDPPDIAQRQEAEMHKARLWAAIAELPDGQRQCIELWLSDNDLKYEGIAKVLGITVDAVKSRLRDAKRTLHTRLGESLPED